MISIGAQQLAGGPGGGEKRNRLISAWRTAAVVSVIGLMVWLRFVALGSDPYPRLDWSAGLLTDEGFYVHNARNLALFGHVRTDEFNNMLLSPVLHIAQAALFSVAGVGSVQARLISVLTSLCTLATLFAAVRRSFGIRIAYTASLFLGLDHTNLLYNRMALMDTPACLPAAAAFYAFVRGSDIPDDSVAGSRRVWYALCGALIGVTLASRMLCAYLVPVPFVALLFSGRKDSSSWRNIAAVSAGLAAILAAYALLWYWPNRAEIGPMAAYYRTHQIQPRSVAHLVENLRHAVVGDFRGMSPYLFRHTPVVFGLALAGIAGAALRSSGMSHGRALGSSEVYLLSWLMCGAAMLSVISYSPSRYYVSVYPALACVAAITLWRVVGRSSAESDRTDSVEAPRESEPKWIWPLATAAVAGFLGFHAVLAKVHYAGSVAPVARPILLYGLPMAFGASVYALCSAATRMGGRPGWMIGLRKWAPGCLLAVWAIVNAAWLEDWSRGVSYTQRNASLWLAANLPKGSVLIGDIAPGISLDNPFAVVHVQPGLANDVRPVERAAGPPRFVAILDGRWKEAYWLRNYPVIVNPARRLILFHVLRWDVGIYPVEESAVR